MNVKKPVAKKVVYVIIVFCVTMLLGACAAPKRIDVQDIAWQKDSGIVLHSNLRMTLVNNPNETVPFYVSTPFGKEEFPQFSHMATAESYAAAKAVLGHIGLISEETTFSPHIVAKITKCSCNQRFVSPICAASIELYWGTGEFINTYKSDETFWYPFTPTHIDVYNVYVKIFENIVNQILKDELLSKYFDKGFDDSLSSSTPDIPGIPYLQAKLQKEREEAQHKIDEAKRIAQAETNLRESKAILSKARSRKYALVDEMASLFSFGPISSVLNALILESLLPFPKEMDQALMSGDLQEAKSISHQWRNWLERCQGHVSQEAEDSVKNQLAHLDILDHRLSDPVVGQLTIKLAQAIEAERWEDAKNIASLIETTSPPAPPKPAIVETVQVPQNLSNSTECSRAQQDYNQAKSKYNSAKSGRGTSRLLQSVGILGMFSPIAKNQMIGSLYNSGGRSSAEDAQADMNHALELMQDAKNRMAIYCGN